VATRRFGSASIASAAAEYVEDQASPRGRRVERVGQTSERGASLAQGVDGVDQLTRRTREAIELADDQCVALMDRFHRFEQGGSIDCGVGDMLSEDLFRIRLRSATSGSARF
jgi:hypothetical protein